MAFNKKVKKLYDKECKFCGEDNYALLDVHRLTPGSEGGKYHERNTITVCANCHRRLHSGEIIADRKYLRSDGRYVLHYWREGKEFYD